MTKRSQNKKRFTPVNYKMRWFELTKYYLCYYDVESVEVSFAFIFLLFRYLFLLFISHFSIAYRLWTIYRHFRMISMFFCSCSVSFLFTLCRGENYSFACRQIGVFFASSVRLPLAINSQKELRHTRAAKGRKERQRSRRVILSPSALRMPFRCQTSPSLPSCACVRTASVIVRRES